MITPLLIPPGLRLRGFQSLLLAREVVVADDFLKHLGDTDIPALRLTPDHVQDRALKTQQERFLRRGDRHPLPPDQQAPQRQPHYSV